MIQTKVFYFLFHSEDNTIDIQCCSLITTSGESIKSLSLTTVKVIHFQAKIITDEKLTINAKYEVTTSENNVFKHCGLCESILPSTD